MSIKVVVGVGDKSIEKFIADMIDVDVLTTVRRREAIVDSVINYNPHAIILSMALPGKVDYREILPKIRDLRHRTKIVFLYGDRDGEFKLFADFLVQNGIYNFLVGPIDPYNLTDIITNDLSLADVAQYSLSQEDKLAELFSKEEREKKEREERDAGPKAAPVQGIPAAAPSKELEVLIVEKIIERETIQTQVIGNIRIGVGSLFPRAGCTHTAIELGSYLKKMKKDVGILVDQHTYSSLKEYYLIEGNGLEIQGLAFYKDETMALNNHRAVIYDMGQLDTEQKLQDFYRMNCKMLLCPTAAWEIDRLTDFVRGNEFATKVSYLLFPATAKNGKALEKNLERGGCAGETLSYNPDPFVKSGDNWRVYQRHTAKIANSF